MGFMVKPTEQSRTVKKLKTAAYCRVSTDSDEQAGSLESQRRYFQEYIDCREELEFSGVYYDEGISGTQTANRQGFSRMMDDALHHRIDLILTKEVSRFARNTVDTLSCTRRLRAAGVGVIFTIDQIDTRQPDGELRLTIMASIAQEESRKTSERVKWGQKRRMEQGVVFGRNLLGYTVKNGNLEINEAQASVVRTIFRKYTDEGKGTHVIADELMKEGMFPMKAEVWNPGVILRILHNEKYVGDLCQKKTYTPDFLTHRKEYNRGEEELICIADHHEPIIDRNLWNRTQKELQRRSRSGRGREKYSSRYWCSTRLYCGVCGKHFISRTKKLKNGGIYRAWRCSTAAGSGTDKMGADDSCTVCSSRSFNDRSLLFCMNYCLCHISLDEKSVNREVLRNIRSVYADDRMEEIAGFLEKFSEGTFPKQLYRVLLDHMVLYPDSVIEIYLKGLTRGFRLVISAGGKMEHYRTVVHRMDLIDRAEKQEENGSGKCNEKSSH